MHQWPARLFQHDRDRLAVSECEHFSNPRIDVFGRLLEFPVKALAITIDDVAIMFLIGPVYADKKGQVGRVRS
jgi:hypothetical protein